MCAGIKNDTYVIVSNTLSDKVEQYLSDNKVLHAQLTELPKRTDWNYKYVGEKITAV